MTSSSTEHDKEQEVEEAEELEESGEVEVVEVEMAGVEMRLEDRIHCWTCRQ